MRFSAVASLLFPILLMAGIHPASAANIPSQYELYPFLSLLDNTARQRMYRYLETGSGSEHSERSAALGLLGMIREKLVQRNERAEQLSAAFLRDGWDGPPTDPDSPELIRARIAAIDSSIQTMISTLADTGAAGTNFDRSEAGLLREIGTFAARNTAALSGDGRRQAQHRLLALAQRDGVDSSLLIRALSELRSDDLTGGELPWWARVPFTPDIQSLIAVLHEISARLEADSPELAADLQREIDKLQGYDETVRTVLSRIPYFLGAEDLLSYIHVSSCDTVFAQAYRDLFGSIASLGFRGTRRLIHTNAWAADELAKLARVFRLLGERDRRIFAAKTGLSWAAVETAAASLDRALRIDREELPRAALVSALASEKERFKATPAGGETFAAFAAVIAEAEKRLRNLEKLFEAGSETDPLDLKWAMIELQSSGIAKALLRTRPEFAELNRAAGEYMQELYRTADQRTIDRLTALYRRSMGDGELSDVVVRQLRNVEFTGKTGLVPLRRTGFAVTLSMRDGRVIFGEADAETAMSIYGRELWNTLQGEESPGVSSVAVRDWMEKLEQQVTPLPLVSPTGRSIHRRIESLSDGVEASGDTSRTRPLPGRRTQDDFITTWSEHTNAETAVLRKQSLTLSEEKLTEELAVASYRRALDDWKMLLLPSLEMAGVDPAEIVSPRLNAVLLVLEEVSRCSLPPDAAVRMISFLTGESPPAGLHNGSGGHTGRFLPEQLVRLMADEMRKLSDEPVKEASLIGGRQLRYRLDELASLGADGFSRGLSLIGFSRRSENGAVSPGALLDGFIENVLTAETDIPVDDMKQEAYAAYQGGEISVSEYRRVMMQLQNVTESSGDETTEENTV